MMTPAIIDSYASTMLGAALGLLLANGNSPELLHVQIDQAIKAIARDQENPALLERFTDVAVSTVIDLLETP